MGRLTESSIVNYKNKSHAVTAEVVVPAAGAQGVIVAVGGIAGGWTFYCKDGRLRYVYNFYGVEHYAIDGTMAVPEGTHQVRMEFAYDGGGLAKGGTVSLFIDGTPAGSGRVERTEPLVFSADETCDVGYEAGSPVTPDYPTPQGRFSGSVNWVEIAVDEAAEDLDHLLSPQERYRVAMGLQ
jgi:arylsulfatase